MAVVPIRFRCYRCNKLLGVSASKAGAVVACPNCSAELVVPEPSQTAPTGAVEGTTPSSTRPSFLPPDALSGGGESDAGIPLDLLQIRPEDIRVEAEADPVLGGRPAPSEASKGAAEPVAAEPVSPLTPPRQAAEPSSQRGNVLTEIPSLVETLVVPKPVVDDPVMPPIQFEDPIKTSPAARRTLTPRPTDLVIPRSVVAAWSFFVLLALAFAFAAGLLAGHFVWKVHGQVAPTAWNDRGTRIA